MVTILVASVVLVATLGVVCYVAWSIFLAAIKQTATLAYLKGWTDAMEMCKQWEAANAKGKHMQTVADYLLSRIPAKVKKEMVN